MVTLKHSRNKVGGVSFRNLASLARYRWLCFWYAICCRFDAPHRIPFLLKYISSFNSTYYSRSWHCVSTLYRIDFLIPLFIRLLLVFVIFLSFPFHQFLLIFAHFISFCIENIILRPAFCWTKINHKITKLNQKVYKVAYHTATQIIAASLSIYSRR